MFVHARLSVKVQLCVCACWGVCEGTAVCLCMLGCL